MMDWQMIGVLLAILVQSLVVGKFMAGLATKVEVEKKDEAQSKALKEKVQERDAKFKEHGEWINRDFVRKGMCDQAHAFMDKENYRKEEDSKTFRLEMKEAFHQLQRQFENFQKEMFERLPKKE
jgi:hypothetical protein